MVTNVYPYGAVEIEDQATSKRFKVNGHRLKPFYEGLKGMEVEEISLEEPTY